LDSLFPFLFSRLVLTANPWLAYVNVKVISIATTYNAIEADVNTLKTLNEYDVDITTRRFAS